MKRFNRFGGLLLAGLLVACSRHEPTATPAAATDTIAVTGTEADETKDPELIRLEEAAQHESSNAGMKEAARNLADYWDRRLVRAERLREQKLDPQGVALFRVAGRAWRNHRAAEVELEADAYRGGSMASLVATQQYVAMTEARTRSVEFATQERPGER